MEERVAALYMVAEVVVLTRPTAPKSDIVKVTAKGSAIADQLVLLLLKFQSRSHCR